MPETLDQSSIRSLTYGLRLLRAFTPERPHRGVTNLAEEMRVHPATAHRYASTCLDLGYLEQVSARRYRLTRRAAAPGLALLQSIPVTAAAAPILRQLRRETGRTVGLAILDGDEVLYLQRLCGFQRGQREIERGLGMGSHRSAKQTAAGQALLGASSTEGRRFTSRTGLTINRGGLHSAAIGLALKLDTDLAPASAIELTVPDDAMLMPDLIATYGEMLRAAASALEGTLFEDPADARAVGLAS
jgi:DNA-binding IclR family transcriptional regulator